MVHGKKERRRIIIIRRNGAKTISLQTLFGRLNNKKRSKNNKSPKLCLGDLIILNDRVFYFLSTAIVILIVIVIRINHYD
jgi:hypothetical protein